METTSRKIMNGWGVAGGSRPLLQ
ncbi:hypothetical protein ACMD2_25785 [Ananas comosus]|uniref:Uncharacterized protein n=1 Tax=Ananas comosus TaxID=4615 RepID=A0A199UL10_ANACO|nr:hypothetical protein ACMD2_25785 [Ananas comosus]